MTKTFSLPDVDSLDEVPEEYRAYYYRKDGQIVRQNPAAMASTLAKMRREAEELKGDRDALKARWDAVAESFGADATPEKIREIKARADKAIDAPTDEEFNKRVRIIEETAKKQIEALKKQIDERDAIIEKEAVEAQIRDALKRAGAREEALDILPELLRRRVEKRFEDGRLKLQPLDADNLRMYAEDGHTPATLYDLAVQIRSQKPIFFSAPQPAGLGSGGSPGSGAPAPDWFKMTPAEKAEFSRKHGAAAVQNIISKSVQQTVAQKK